MYVLYLGNKNYSSWSLRPWLVMKHFGIPFTEHTVPVGGRQLNPALQAISGNARVPVLHDDGFQVWESIAILEYLAERHVGLNRTVSFILADSQQSGGCEALLSFWGEPFMAQASGHGVPRFIFHVQRNSLRASSPPAGAGRLQRTSAENNIGRRARTIAAEAHCVSSTAIPFNGMPGGRIRAHAS